MTLQYRPEIDGLRTLAVIPVIVFHSGLGLPGGFVGVDVFFVISGFLIGSILIDEWARTGHISVAGFYERRARRIIPALVFVIFACLPLAWMLMLPSELDLFGRSMAATMLFVSNILYWQNSGYFAPATELMPLLHTWSLAVEEQYYILFPLFLIVAWRLGRLWVSAFLLAGIICSFALGELASHTNPSAAFYLLPTRAWELLIGALLAILTYGRTQPKGWLAQASAAVGFAAIVVAVVLYDKSTPWPGLWALAPVLGTAAIIWGGGNTFIGRALSLKPMVGVGLISYSAYLWHQPLFAFARLHLAGETTPFVMTVLSIIALGLAWATWRIVERPFRNRSWFSHRWILGGTGVSIAVVCFLGIVLASKNGVPERFPDWQRAWLVPPPGGYGRTVEQPYLRELIPMGREEPEGAVLLIGDSFSQDFYNIIRATDLLDDINLHSHLIHNQCQPILIERRTAQVASEQGPANCHAAALTPDEIQLMAKYDTVVMVTNWKEWSISESILVAQAIEKLGGRLIVVGKKRFAEGGLRPFAGRTLEEIKDMRMPKPRDIAEMDQFLREIFGRDQFLSIMDALCDDSTGDESCPLATSDGTPFSYDGGHLTPAGVAYFAERLEPKLRAALVNYQR